MEPIRILLSRFAALFRGRELDEDLDAELRVHIDLAIEENVKGGMTAQDARTDALRKFGGMTQIAEIYRVQRGVPFVRQMARDARFAIRQLRKSPGFTFTAILTLAFGIGAATSVFSVVDAVLLKPLAFRDSDRLLVLREVVEQNRSERSAEPVNFRHYLRLKNDAKSVEDAAIFQQRGMSISPTGDHPRIVGAVVASPSLFRMLGVQPMLGRDFVDADASKGAANVVVLSYEGWQAFFAGNPKVVGETLRLGGDPATVIGVLPPGMRFPRIALAPNIASGAPLTTMVYAPLTPSDWDLSSDTGNFNYSVIARLKDGVTLAQASAELETLQNAYTVSTHLPIHLGIALTPLATDVTSGISGALWLLFAAVGAVLLIACVNLANLQLARAVSAERETAVRAALGASKGQLVMARLAESLLLALAGGLAGVALAFTGVRLLLVLVPPNVPRVNEVQVSMPVLLFAAVLSITIALAFGILPALRSLHVQPQTALQASSSRTTTSREGRTRSILVAGQVACTVALLIVTSLALRSFSRLLRQDRGFDSSHVTLAQVDLFSPEFSDKIPKVKEVKLAFADHALTALQRLPGVQLVTVTSAAPLTGETWVDELERPDHPLPEAQRPMINLRWINQDYLATMQIPLISGRNLTAADRANPYVALISEKTARDGFPGENPIGRTISDIVPDDEHSVTVIGVVADTRINGLKDEAAMIYMPYWAYTPWTLSFLVRSSQPSGSLISEMRRAIWQIDPQVAIPTLKSMDEQLSDSVSTERFQVVVLTSFGAAALLLALLGVYGVTAYSVSLRQQEFGIRIALGSNRAALTLLVLRQAAYPVLGGITTGLGAAFVATRLVRSMLYETQTADPVAIAVSIGLLLAVAVLAAMIPARRAASTDPMRALRTE
jgi:predicted permease